MLCCPGDFPVCLAQLSGLWKDLQVLQVPETMAKTLGTRGA